MVRATFKRGAKLERWERRLQNPTDALKQIGALMVAESQESFRNQRLGKRRWDARGNPNVFGIIADFAAGKRSPPNRRFQSRPALIDTGRLRSSISFRVLGDSVEVGSNLEYAAVHQEGGQVESETITRTVQQRLWEWLKTQGTARRAQLGWLLNKKFTDQTLTAEVPARPFVGITRQTIEDVQEVVAVAIMEAR